MPLISRYVRFAACLFILCLATAARAEDDGDELTLLGFVSPDEQQVTAVRTPRPVSRIAENVTVITARQIEELNAHTLAEVLNTVPGIQFAYAGRTPGSFSHFYIQGASSQSVLVMIDGVSQNEQGQNIADLGMMPVQQIERVEIIKGGSSAVWGQALGGVVNVITKAPNREKPFSGATYSSIGDRFTTDQHGEASGTVDRFGYYLSGGLLHSDGLLPNNGINQNDIFAKLIYDLPEKGRITYSVANVNSRRGLVDAPLPDYWHDYLGRQNFSTSLILDYPLADRLTLQVTTFYQHLKINEKLGTLLTLEPQTNLEVRETIWGGNALLLWGDSRNSLTAGLDFERLLAEGNDFSAKPSMYNIHPNFNRFGVSANGTLSFGPLTILPGIRYDRVDAAHNEVSYTLGATYGLSGKTILRAYGARGYSRSQAIFLNLPTQKGWTAQAGIETGDLPYLWFKGTLFYNDTWDVPVSVGVAQTSSQVRQGFEIEGRTVTFFGFSLTAGYTMTDIRDKETRDRLYLVPGDLLKLAVTYDHPAWGLHGLLTGNYVWWHSPAPRLPQDRSFLWDLHLTQKLPVAGLAAELFLNVHNLFNTSQYGVYQYPNAGRWLEGGVRVRF